MTTEQKLTNEEIEDKRPVRIVWCECGGSIELAGEPNMYDKETVKYLRRAQENNQKIEIVTITEFYKLPFMSCPCFGESTLK